MAKGRWDQSNFAGCILEGLKQAQTKTLNYAKLADIEQGEKESPDKFLDRLWETLCSILTLIPKIQTETKLKDRFLTQSAPDTCHKLEKQVFGPNQS